MVFGRNICKCQKKVVPLQSQRLKTKDMLATPTFRQVFDMACMLPRQEQQELIQKVQYHILHIEMPEPISKEDLFARLEHADAMIDEGHFMEHEDAKKHFQSRMAQKTARL